MDFDCGGACSAEVTANIQPASGAGRNWAGSYDLNSLMHYGNGCIGSGPGSCFTVVPKAGVLFHGAS